MKQIGWRDRPVRFVSPPEAIVLARLRVLQRVGADTHNLYSLVKRRETGRTEQSRE